MKEYYLKKKCLYLVKISFFLCFWNGLLTTSFAYQITWPDLMEKVLNNEKKNQLILTTSVEIFQPFIREKEDKVKWGKVAELSFQQKIYWILGELLAVEIFSDDHKILHFYFEYKGDIVNVSTQKDRFFTEQDILPDYLRFIVRRSKDWENALRDMNIQGRQISLYRGEDGNIYHQIGNAKSANFLLLNQKDFLVSSLQFGFQMNHNEHIVQIHFKEMIKDKAVNYPKQTDYLLDHQLFKRVTLNTIETDQPIPLEILHQKAIKWSRRNSASFQYNFAK